MSWREFECPGCGDVLPSLFASILHCEWSEPIDDLDNPDIIPGID